MDINYTLRMIGLARKANNIRYGDENTSLAVRDGRASLIILSADAAENTKKRVLKLSEESKVPILEIPATKAELGRAIGKETCAVLAVCNRGIANAIQ